jgi:tRNA pseudouridine13 synthase
MSTVLPDWPRAWGDPPIAAVMRAAPEDFIVDEVLGFAPDGEGEHALLQIRKRGANTEFVARALARHAGVRQGDVSYAGLKDRHAVTTQWFSVHLPGQPDPDWSALESDELRIITSARHSRKLRRGALRANRFRITLRDVAGDDDALAARLDLIAREGVPNGFGPQRFGRHGDNLARAAEMFAGGRIRDRSLRGLYLSAARSFLFNEVLARRISERTWNVALPGDVMMLDGSHSHFHIDAVDTEIQRRVAAFDIHPTGPLWGRGTSPVSGASLALERSVIARHEEWCRGLEMAGLNHERRSLRLPVKAMSWLQPEAGTLQVGFELPAGAYATAVMREIVAGDVG